MTEPLIEAFNHKFGDPPLSTVAHVKEHLTEMTKEDRQALYEFLHISCDCRINKE